MSQANQNEAYATRITLMQRVQNRYDERAWAEFADVYKRYIYAIIRSMKVSSHDAEEIHQQIMLKLWKLLPTLKVEEIRRFRSYLATIAKNEVLQFIRSQKRRIEREAKACKDQSLDYLESIRISETEEIAQQEWRIHLTNLALKRISDKFSEKAIQVFRLSIDGLSPEAIAEKTGLTLKSVHTFKSRVRRHFTVELEHLRDNLD